MIKEHPLAKLAVAYPDLADTIAAVMKEKDRPADAESIALMVEETLWALSQEISFGRSVALGYVDLLGQKNKEEIIQYKDLVRRFGNQGPTLGKIMATHLVPVLKRNNKKLLERFIEVVNIMLNKGTYTLSRPLQILSSLLEGEELKAVISYLDLLGETFSQKLSYVQCQNFAQVLPQAVAAFSSSRRTFQIDMLKAVIQADFRLAYPFLDGLQNGLNLLSKDALNRFVSLGLDKFAQNRQQASKFIALESKLGIDTFNEMQVTVPISQVQHQLNRYLQARTGMSISVRPLSSLSRAYVEAHDMKPLACSDGQFIYLPPEIDMLPTKDENKALYKCLAKLEAGYYEFRTFEFDLQRVVERCQQKARSASGARQSHWILNLVSGTRHAEGLSDLERFFSIFPLKGLASDLFTIFEHGRIRLMLTQQYPGLMRQAISMFRRELDRMDKEKESPGSIFQLYLAIALGTSNQNHIGSKRGIAFDTAAFVNRFEKKMGRDCTVEACAELVAIIYPKIIEVLKQSGAIKNVEKDYIPLKTPFGRKIKPDLLFAAYRKYEGLAKALKTKIEEKGFKIYQSDLNRRLMENNGFLTHQDLKQMIFLSHKNNASHDITNPPDISIDLTWLDLTGLFADSGFTQLYIQDFSGTVAWHNEWNDNLQDYLQKYVRVLDQTTTSLTGDFYDVTLQRYRGLVKKIRYAFELLKPEGLIRLRQWIEGDEFDYRAMLDFAVDKKAGKIPSERLYIKHIKQLRDVSVLLLVDLSRSTANSISGSPTTVMNLEKEAIVLFCEALEVVGDDFAIAGFSGTGRLGVDYFRVKDFDEKTNDSIKQRINALAPRRSTRMGAAIRHATRQLEGLSSKIRLLIVLSDGFPNDVDYKQKYAVADTRKAISEARAKNICTHGITINIAGDSRLDDLYGNVHHNIISDVRELPDKLLRIYSGLTRH